MYRAALESMLGFILKAETLKIEPCIPRNWQELEIDFRHGKTLYQIRVENPSGVCRGIVEVRLDGNLLPSSEISLVNDEQNHQIKIIMGEKGA